MKLFKVLFVLILCSVKLLAQDAILISEGNFVRGIIKGTNYISVAIIEEDQTLKEYLAKDIQSFIWNGETYASKPIVIKKKMEFRFFKLIESGAVNLYAYGDKGMAEQVQQPKVKVRPTFGVGMGTGGFGGGVGGGVSINLGGRRNQERANTVANGKISYFLEKPGTGPIQEVSLDNTNAVKAILLLKLADDEDLITSIKATHEFDEKNLTAIIKAYNAGKN